MAAVGGMAEAGAHHDLTDLLDRLHEDIEVEPEYVPDSGDELTDPRDLERSKMSVVVAVESTGGLGFRPSLASFLVRFVGLLVDSVVLALGLAPGFYVLANRSRSAMTLAGLALLVVGFAVVNVWYARSVARTGQWIGNRVTRTRVVDAINGSNLDVGRAALRFAGRHLVSIVFLFGFLQALGDGERRSFHDRLVGSVVTTRTRASWSADDDE